jgi:hypothetical protein
MIIDFKEMQARKFDTVVEKIQNSPEKYLNFESVSDFYKAPWLNEFPQGTTWSCSGLDDGAEHFYAVIEYQNRRLKINCLDEISIDFDIIAK